MDTNARTPTSPDPVLREQDTPYQLACDIHAFAESIDTYGYWDAVYVYDMEQAINGNAQAIAEGVCDSQMKCLAGIMRDYADDPEMAEDVEYAQSLLDRLGAYIDNYAIYQLNEGPEMREYRFEALDQLTARELSVESDHYQLMYQEHLPADASLDSIYQKFNVNRPSDFQGHSLSMSDVIVLQKGGQKTAHYVDRFGFRGVPGFLERERQPRLASAEVDHQRLEKTNSSSEHKSEKPSVFAQLHAAKIKPAQGQERNKAAPKQRSDREV